MQTRLVSGTALTGAIIDTHAKKLEALTDEVWPSGSAEVSA